ncbi:MAG: redox-regulated ATPase YchF [Saccharofermentanales bacterium]
MQLGIVGLPNVGKSTLFNAITKAGAEAANYPFCTIDPNIGVVTVPDKRLDFLASLYNPAKYTPAVMEFVDIAGIVKGASKGEGLGNKFLSNIRNVDAILHVVRCFDDPNVVHVEGATDPARDIEIIDLELILADMAWMEKRIDKVAKLAKSRDNVALEELPILEKISSALQSGIPARRLEFSDSEKQLMGEIYLLTLKPVLYAANIAEKDVGLPDSAYVAKVRETAEAEGAEIVVISAKIEEEIAMLDDEEKALFLEDLHLDQSGLDKVIQAGYRLLGLISFLTAGPTEVRAWTIKKGTKAPAAAGKIHSDIERGFIRAEIVSFNDLVSSKTYAAAKEHGLVRSEGKDYVMQDGDVTLFRFNV